MNIKNKAVLIVSLVILFLSGFYLFQGISQFNREMNIIFEEEEKTIDNTLNSINKYSLTHYSVALKDIAEHNADIQKAFADRNRELLFKHSIVIYNNLREDNSYFHAWDFNLPNGDVFLRVQEPKLYGDNISRSRPIIQAVHDKKQQFAGFDIGKHGAIYWVAQPVFYKGNYVGAMEMGIPVKQLTDALEERFKTEVTTLVKAEQWQKADFVKSGFRVFGDQVLMTHGESIYNQIPDDFLFSKRTDQKFKLNGKTIVLHNCAVLKNHNNELIGNILVFRDITAALKKKWSYIWNSVLITFGLLVLSFSMLYFSFGGLIGKLEAYANENKKAREEIEKINNELELRVRERTAELEKSNSSLDEQRVFLRTIIDSLTHPFYVIDAETYKIVMANNAACSKISIISEGSSTCYGMTHYRTEPCVGDDHPCPMMEVKETGKSLMVVHEHTDSTGNIRAFEIHAYPVLNAEGNVCQVIEYSIDITERRKAEEENQKINAQLMQSQKMEAIGTLAGGIAHDFNNILMAIMGFTEIALYKAPKGTDLQDCLTKSLKAANRAKELIQQILSFSRHAEQKHQPLQIQSVLKEALKLIRASIPTTIEIRQNIDNNCGAVLADPVQIHQLIMNLCTNAYHAMKDKGGVLSVSLKPVIIGEDSRQTTTQLFEPGAYVKLEISDTGYGIDRSIIDRIFEPYFTTKGPGEGTGMGLALVHGIVKSHGGNITVYSEPGIGSTFNVFLPIFKSETLESRKMESTDKAVSLEALPRGRERILFIDDEEEILALGQMLEGLGYEVQGEKNSLEALEKFQSEPDYFDIVITDMTMPGITGADLAQKMLSIRKNIPIILSTGFSEFIDAEKAKMIGIREFIMKPVLLSDLAVIIRRVLDGK